MDSNQAIQMEIVHGKREDVYWEKVPEKVRQQAVRNAIAQTHVTDDEPELEATADKRMRKRRKRDK
jgi:ribosomal protein L4